MIEVEMSKDIKDFSPKIISIFDKRQLVCLGIATVLGWPVFLAIKDKGWDMTISCTIIALVVAFPLACGWVKMYGLPLEVFLLTCIVPMLFSPTKRKYKTVNSWEYLDPQPPIPADPKTIKRPKMKRAQKKKFKADREKYGASS